MLEARMTGDVYLLGTQLALQEHQLVKLVPATNQPPRPDGKKQYFASPASGVWHDHYTKQPLPHLLDHDGSILVTEDDVEAIFPGKTPA